MCSTGQPTSNPAHNARSEGLLNTFNDGNTKKNLVIQKHCILNINEGALLQ